MFVAPCLRVVGAVDGVVLDVDADGVAGDRVLGVGLLDRELDAVRGGLAVGGLATLIGNSVPIVMALPPVRATRRRPMPCPCSSNLR